MLQDWGGEARGGIPCAHRVFVSQQIDLAHPFQRAVIPLLPAANPLLGALPQADYLRLSLDCLLTCATPGGCQLP